MDATWNLNGTGDYNTAANWTPATVPDGTATFGLSNQNAVTVSGQATVGGWTFNAGASAYSFSINNAPTEQLRMLGAGIIINGGSATITNNNRVWFENASTAGSATIVNNLFLSFFNTSTAGSAAIIQSNSGVTDFGTTFGPNNDDKVSVGSIAGGGVFALGKNELTVGANNLSTNVTGSIQDGGFFSFFTGASLVKIGTGTLTLSGTNTYTGATTVNDGTLTVNGSTGTSALTTVNAGGTLMGTGTVGNTTVAGGVFAPGSGTPGTTQTVSGTLGFSAGGIYRVFVDPAASSSANVTGTATLTGGTVNGQFAAGSYVSRQYTILTAGTRTGTFDALTTANLPTGFTASLGYATANAVTLDLALAIGNGTSSLPPNQQGPANAIANFFNNGGALPPGFVTLAGLTGAQQQNGFAQVSGEGGNGATQTASYTATNLFVGTMLDSSIDNREDDAGGGAAGYANESPEVMAFSRSEEAAARKAFAKLPLKAVARDQFAARWSVWATGYGGSSKVNGDLAAGTNTTNSSIYGTAVGAGYRIGPDTLIGFAMGGAGINFHTAQDLGGGRADIFQLGLYGHQSFGAAYIAGALAYGWQDVTTDRTVTVAGTDRLRANFDTNTFAARAETGYRFAMSWVGVTPYGALQATTFHSPSYAEAAVSGSNQFALAFASQNTTNVRSELGLRTNTSFAVEDGRLTLRGRAAWAHDSNTDRIITPTFQALPGSGAFTVNGAKPSADAALVTAGAEMKWRNGWSIAGLFEGEFSRTTESYAGKATVRYTW